MNRHPFKYSFYRPKATIKDLFILLLVFFHCFLSILNHSLHAQVISVDTLIWNCPTSHCLNIVILGDGYTAEEMNKFQEDAESVTNRLFEEAPFSNYQNYFNVFLLRVVSQESGIIHAGTTSGCPDPGSHPISNPNNYFGTRFDVSGIHRLVVPQYKGLIIQTLAENMPEYDIVLIIANTPFYGGSGGTFATTTTHHKANLIAIHEIGHSFSGLADEYYAGPSYMFERPNLTQVNDPGTIKWRNWLSPETSIGIHSHTGDESWFKPTQHNCMMERMDKTFCEVCSETTTYKIMSLVNPILSQHPVSQDIDISGSETFSLELLLPEPNTLLIEWELNGLIIDHDSTNYTLNPALLDPGINHVAVKVTDLTTLIRKDPPEYNTAWNVNYQPTSTVQTEIESMYVRIAPNPAGQSTRIYTGNTSHVSLQIFDRLGRPVIRVVDYYPGTEIDLSNLPAGLYFATVTKGMHLATATFMKL